MGDLYPMLWNPACADTIYDAAEGFFYRLRQPHAPARHDSDGGCGEQDTENEVHPMDYCRGGRFSEDGMTRERIFFVAHERHSFTEGFRTVLLFVTARDRIPEGFLNGTAVTAHYERAMSRSR